MSPELLSAYKATRAAETLDNYSRADQIKISNLDLQENPLNHSRFSFYEDETFWEHVREKYIKWGDQINFRPGGVISEWVARIPGLYWMPESSAIRQVSESMIESIGNINTLTPIGKSSVVIGGIGTLKIPPDINGYRLVTYSMNSNASTGIPILIAPDVWYFYDISEGSTFELNDCEWTEIPSGWSQHFPSTRNAVRGCILVREISNIEYVRQRNPTQIHPFAIMEYETPNGEILHDFVFVSAVTNQSGYRNRISDFFEYYLTANGRFGKYLTAGDISDPLWESKFNTPEDLLRTSVNAEAQLDVLLARIHGTMSKGKTIDAINIALINGYDIAGLKRLAEYVKIPKGLLPDNETVSNFSIRLIDKCLERRCLDALVDWIIKERPSLIM